MNFSKCLRPSYVCGIEATDIISDTSKYIYSIFPATESAQCISSSFLLDNMTGYNRTALI